MFWFGTFVLNLRFLVFAKMKKKILLSFTVQEVRAVAQNDCSEKKAIGKNRVQSEVPNAILQLMLF